MRMVLKVPIRLISITLRNKSRSWGVPSRARVRLGSPIPAQFTATRSSPSRPAASTPAITSASLVTSQWTNRPPSSSARASPCSSAMSRIATRDPAAANARAEAAPSPDAPPVTTAAAPVSSMPSTSFDDCLTLLAGAENPKEPLFHPFIIQPPAPLEREVLKSFAVMPKGRDQGLMRSRGM